MYSYRQGDNEQKIKPLSPIIAFTILFPLLFAALVSGLTNPKRLLPTNGNGKKRGEQRQSGTPDRRKNWKLKAAASRSGPGNTLEVESRKTRVHTLHPQAAPLAARECASSTGGGGGHLPGPPARPPALPGPGDDRLRGPSPRAARPGKRPVRADFTRQECAPPPPPPRGARPRVSPARPPGAAPRRVPPPSGPRTARPGESRARLPAPFRGPSGAPNPLRP